MPSSHFRSMNRISFYFLTLLLGLSCAISVMGTASNGSGSSLPRVVEGKVVRLTLDAKGELKLNGKAVKLKDLKNELLKISRKPEELDIIVSADDNCPAVHLTEVLDSLKDAGVSKISLEDFLVRERKNP